MDLLSDYATTIQQTLQKTLITDRFETIINNNVGLEQCRSYFLKTQHKNGIVHCVGNGGSAAIAAHLQNDLMKGNQIRTQIYTSSPLLTAYCNDESYSVAYARQLELWVNEKDLLIAISSSGASENILHVVAAAQKANAKIVTLSGFSATNALRQTGDLNFYLPASDYGIVEMGHSILCHLFSDLLHSQHRTQHQEVHA